MFFISQLGEQDCAFACLKMMLANYHHDKNYLYLPRPKEDSPYSFQELIDYSKNYNLILRGIKVTSALELFNCKTFPIIVNLKRKKNSRHSVLLLRANKKNVTMFDPDSGKRKMPIELFMAEWTMTALIVEEVIPSKCPKIFPSFISKRDKIILPILQLLSGVSVLMGTYFISGDSPFYLPLIFFILFIIFEVLFRSSLVGAMKRMDENIYEYGFKVKDQNYMDVYKTIEKYRQTSLSMIPNFIYSWLIAIFITVVLVINGPINFIYVILPLALAAINVFFYRPFFNNESMNVMKKEQEITDVENDFQFKMKSSEAHNVAYRLGLNRSIYTYLEVSSLLLTIILTMVITKTIQITYVIFYLCITFFLKTNFEKILEFESQLEEYDATKTRLIDSLIEKDNNS